MSTYVLVPGFWLGAWAWREVTRALRAAGHEVYPVTLSGLAERAHLGGPGVDVDIHVADVLALIEMEELREVVLVGHSGAGAIVTAVAEKIRERIARLVYVDSGPLPDGAAQIETNSPESRALIEEQIAKHGSWPMPSFEELEQMGSSLAGVNHATRERWRRLAVPQPADTVTTPVRRSAPDPTLPKVLIACTFTAEQVRELARQVPLFAELAGSEWTVRELPTGHWPMFSEPAALARLLDEEGRAT